MASSSGPRSLPITSTSEISPRDSSLDPHRPKVHAALRGTMERDAQTVPCLLHILPCFVFSFAACRFFSFSLWNSFLLSLACALGRFFNAFFELDTQPSSQRLKDVNRIPISNPPCGTKYRSPQDNREVDESTIVPAPAQTQAESGVKEVIKTSDSDNKSEQGTSSSGQTNGELDNQRSEKEGQDGSVQEAEGVQEKQESPLANISIIDEGLDAQSPIDITGGDESYLSGDTLVEHESPIDIPRPEFAKECPQLKRKSDAPPPQPRPVLPVDLQYIDRGYTFQDDFGWVIETPKKRNNNALKNKIIQDITEYEDNTGVVYILRHELYENLYKVGCTQKSMKARYASFPPCVKKVTEKVHAIKRMRGFRRVEALAHKDMASRNVLLKICMPCFNKKAEGKEKKKKKSGKGEKNKQEEEQENTSHREWFKGDLEDIKKCVEYWAEVVKVSYVDGEFIGNVSEIANHGLSSQARGLESAKDSARLREKLNESPTRYPQSADAASQPETDKPVAPREEDGADENDGCGEEKLGGTRAPDEVCPGRGRMIWQRQDTIEELPFPTPKKKAPRETRGKKSSGTEGVVAEWMAKKTDVELHPGRRIPHAVQC